MTDMLQLVSGVGLVCFVILVVLLAEASRRGRI